MYEDISPMAQRIMAVLERDRLPYPEGFRFYPDYIQSKAVPVTFLDEDDDGKWAQELAEFKKAIIELSREALIINYGEFFLLAPTSPKLIERRNKMPYKEFLESEYWSKVKTRALDIANHRCTLCNSSSMLHVHHRTYAHRGDELRHMEDLTVLCQTCHHKFHN